MCFGGFVVCWAGKVFHHALEILLHGQVVYNYNFHGSLRRRVFSPMRHSVRPLQAKFNLRKLPVEIVYYLAMQHYFQGVMENFTRPAKTNPPKNLVIHHQNTHTKQKKKGRSENDPKSSETVRNRPKTIRNRPKPSETESNRQL